MGTYSSTVTMNYLFLIALIVPALGARLPGTKIIGGDDAYVGQLPHQASLEFFGSHSCGASLISQSWLVTAAHCVGYSTSFYTIVLGQHDRFSSSEGDPTDHEVDQIILHEDYESGPGAFPNDIAVMRIARPANTASPYISIISMASGSNSDYEGRSGQISGWGHICIGGSGKGSCNGDSGGPLVVGGQLVGATSWGVTGCYTSYPSVYSSVPYYRSWIRGHTGV